MPKSARPKRFAEQPINFRKPPVSEVYLSLQTVGPIFPVGDFGRLSKVHAPRYPKVQIMQQVGRMVEFPPSLDSQVPLHATPKGGPRYWFLSNDETNIVQVQHDRFVYNWRKTNNDQVCPRFDSVRTAFGAELSALLKELKIDARSSFVDVCEVAYNYTIQRPRTADVRSDICKIFRGVSDLNVGVPGITLQEGQFEWTYNVTKPNGEFTGRLRVAAGPRIKMPGSPCILSTLTYRGVPTARSLEGAFEFFDEGHLAVVNAFKNITTPEMHALWEIQTDGRPACDSLTIDDGVIGLEPGKFALH